MIKQQATLTSPRQANATPSVPQRPEVSPARPAIAARVKMTKKPSKKKKTPPRNGGILFFFMCFLVIFTSAAIRCLPAAHRAAAAHLVPRWLGAPTSVCYMLLVKLQQINQNVIHPGSKSLIWKLLMDLNLELLIVVVEVITIHPCCKKNNVDKQDSCSGWC